ncbi:MAG: YraN family protein [Planctomycetes bacterium]|nr:YraN family protein [Planctomycetota bacterium]
MDPRRPWWRRWWGNRSERHAQRCLRRLGWTIIARNASCPMGELDIVALDGATLVFVEVRSTSGSDPMVPAASVDREKQARVARMAIWFRRRHRLEALDCRFDVLAIAWPPGADPVVEHHRDAFDIPVHGGMDT